MEINNFVDKRVHEYYWSDDINCARTMLKTLSEYFQVEINDQVIHSAIGMHGAGKYGAQCGLVEGMLMFMGIVGADSNKGEKFIVDGCYDFAKSFELKFKSLLCNHLRPGGFKEDDPPHACEQLTNKAVCFAIDWFNDNKNFIK